MHLRIRPASIVCFTFVTLLFALATFAAAQSSKLIHFGREIQPIFAKHCFHCHGPNEAKGGLRLNRPETALAALESGLHAIVPGNVAESELFRRIASTDESERMPPEGKPLTKEQIELVRQWIAQGAKWQQHWAFEPVSRPPVPKVNHQSWVRTPIDAFIAQSLEAAGLVPNAPADKVALLRRATYDLTGLPPTWDEIESFAADTSDAAFEKVIDRLLDSERYGEQWGRHWLDVVRYAETNSFERDNPKPHAWRYRDYVIRSLNADKPYDQFIREQLAGDELPGSSAEALIATGYYRLGLWDDEPADRVLARYDELDDIVATTGQAFLGLTVNCARCHDHKIDPFPQQDYYKLVAFFNNVRPMTEKGPNVERQIFIDRASEERHQAAVKSLNEERARVQTEISQIEEQFIEREQQRGARSSSLQRADLEDLRFRYYRDTWDRLPDFATVKPETVGKVPSGLFDISLSTRETSFGFVFDGLLNVPRDGQYTFYLDSDDGSRLSINGKMVIEYDGIHGVGKERSGKVELREGRQPIVVEYFQRSHGLGLRVAWSGTGVPRRTLSNDASQTAAEDLSKLINDRGQEVLGSETFARYTALRRKLDDFKKRPVPGDYALCVTENGGQVPETYILKRGNPTDLGDKIEPGFPGIFGTATPTIASAKPGSPTSGRRTVLANWLSSKDNRLTARVMVNRVWQHHFGRGIVRSPNNFGGLGTPPTHPELLDWLASAFMDGDWRLKPLHRQIMLSSVYQQSSRPSEAALKADTANDLFSRFDMRRLTAEEVRDSVLAVAGRLNLKMYGPSVYPEISDEVKAGQSRPGYGWGNSPPEDQVRRSVYIHVKRSLVTPLLSAFDFPDTDFSCEARFATTQPGQALAMINGKFLNDESANLAARLDKEAGAEMSQRIQCAYRLTLGRQPTDVELDRGAKLLQGLQARHGQSTDAAWKYFCLTMLNRNEFLYLD